MKRMNVIYVLILGIAVMASGCVTKVVRVDPAKMIDLSGQWNDYDAMLVSQEMVKDCLEKPWLTNFLKENGRNPAVIVGHVTNKSSEHIESDVFTKHLEKEVLNSGKVVFVAAPGEEERDQIREEREDQQRGYTDPATIKAIGKERGADFMLIGSINSIKDEVKGKAVVFYKVNLELVSILTNDKVWIGQKEIKKQITRPKASL